MPNSGNNPRFEVLINGESANIIGIEEFGVLAVGVDWVRRHPKAKPSDYTDEAWERNEVDLHVGGLDASRDQHISWRHGHLKVGDEVTVRVLPPGEFDEPQVHRFDPKTGETT